MENTCKTAEIIKAHFSRYNKAGVKDLQKLLFQSSFGCEHLVSSYERAKEYLKSEYASLKESPTEIELLEQLDGGYCRVSLEYLNKGLSLDTFAKLFCLSARREPKGREMLEKKLSVANTLCKNGQLPFGLDELENALAAWRAADYPAISHSEEFRWGYHPAYRVISADYIPFLPLFSRIDQMKNEGRVVLAIEGGSASGKSTLGELLQSVYGCTLFHTDDFFLQKHQRTQERFAEAGGNLDRERFLEEVLIPLSKQQAVEYRRFDCSTFEIQPAERIEPKDITVIEGAYSMHPDLNRFYNLSVFLDIGEELQKKRIEKRNSPWLAQRFFNEWIPMERRYFDFFGIKEKCCMIIPIE